MLISMLFVFTVVTAGLALAALLNSDTQTTHLLRALDSSVPTTVAPMAANRQAQSMLITDAYRLMSSPKVKTARLRIALHNKLVLA